MKFTLNIQGDTQGDLETALEEVLRLVSEGYLAGQDSNETGNYNFDIIEAESATKKRQRVLITVSGGVADYVADEGVDVEIFDHDNYEAGDADLTVSAHFADLAEPIGVPYESTDS